MMSAGMFAVTQTPGVAAGSEAGYSPLAPAVGGAFARVRAFGRLPRRTGRVAPAGLPNAELASDAFRRPYM